VSRPQVEEGALPLDFYGHPLVRLYITDNFQFFQFFLLSKMSHNVRGSVGSKDKESGKEEDVWTCGGCKKDLKDANSKLLECERFDGHYCVQCAKMSDGEYELLRLWRL